MASDIEFMTTCFSRQLSTFSIEIPLITSFGDQNRGARLKDRIGFCDDFWFVKVDVGLTNMAVSLSCVSQTFQASTVGAVGGFEMKYCTTNTDFQLL